MSESDDSDWYLREWMAHFGKKQAGLVNELGWDKARASFIWNSKQSYRREVVNEISTWLGVRPFELLMPPADALALRRLRQAAVEIAEATTPYDAHDQPAPRKRARSG